MSAPAINSAAPPSPGASPSGGAPGVGAGTGVQGAHANGPLSGFEALLGAFFGTQGAKADGALAAGAGNLLLSKLVGKAGPAHGDSKGNAGGDAKATGEAKTTDDKDADAAPAPSTVEAASTAAGAATPDAILALMLQASAVPAAAPSTAPAGGEAPEAPGESGTKSPGQAAVATLAKLLGVTAPASADGSQPKAANVGEFATDATATAKPAVTAPAVSPSLPNPDVPQGAAAKSGLPGPQPAASATSQPAAPAPSQPASQATPQAATPDLPLTASPTAAAAVAAAPARAASAEVKSEPTPPADGKAPRVQGARSDAAPTVNANANAPVKEANALDVPAGGQAKDDALPRQPEAAAVDGKSGPESTPQAPAAVDAAANTAPASLIHAAAIAVRGSPQTVANLAAQIAKKLDGRSTRFDVQLDPAGLGKVDVRVEIGANGRMSAAMAFENPQAAAELKSRSGELQHALEQAGFDLSGGLSFDVAADQGQGQGGRAPGQQDTDSNTGAAFRGRAFQAALDTTADAAPSSPYLSSRSSASGVDIRI
jgi:hypothetical protein